MFFKVLWICKTPAPPPPRPKAVGRTRVSGSGDGWWSSSRVLRSSRLFLSSVALLRMLPVQFWEVVCALDDLLAVRPSTCPWLMRLASWAWPEHSESSACSSPAGTVAWQPSTALCTLPLPNPPPMSSAHFLGFWELIYNLLQCHLKDASWSSWVIVFLFLLIKYSLLFIERLTISNASAYGVVQIVHCTRSGAPFTAWSS